MVEAQYVQATVTRLPPVARCSSASGSGTLDGVASVFRTGAYVQPLGADGQAIPFGSLMSVGVAARPDGARRAAPAQASAAKAQIALRVVLERCRTVAISLLL